MSSDAAYPSDHGDRDSRVSGNSYSAHAIPDSRYFAHPPRQVCQEIEVPETAVIDSVFSGPSYTPIAIPPVEEAHLVVEANSCGDVIVRNIVKTYSQRVVDNTSGIVSYWPLNGDLNDVVGGNHLSGTDVTYEAGVSGQCAVFNGTTTVASKSNATSLILQEFTYAAWVNASSVGIAVQELFGVGGTGADQRLQLGAYEGAFSGSGYDNISPTSEGCVSAPGVVLAGNWHFLAWRKSSASGLMMVFIDGVPASADVPWNGVSTYGGSMLSLGKRFDGSLPFSGRMEDVVIFGRALSEGEIYDLFINGAQAYYLDAQEVWAHELVTWSPSPHGRVVVHGEAAAEVK